MHVSRSLVRLTQPYYLFSLLAQGDECRGKLQKNCYSSQPSDIRYHTLPIGKLLDLLERHIITEKALGSDKHVPGETTRIGRT